MAASESSVRIASRTPPDGSTESLRSLLGRSPELQGAGSSPLLLDGAAATAEPLVEAGKIDAQGRLVEASYAAAALDEVHEPAAAAVAATDGVEAEQPAILAEIAAALADSNAFVCHACAGGYEWGQGRARSKQHFRQEVDEGFEPPADAIERLTETGWQRDLAIARWEKLLLETHVPMDRLVFCPDCASRALMAGVSRAAAAAAASAPEREGCDVCAAARNGRGVSIAAAEMRRILGSGFVVPMSALEALRDTRGGNLDDAARYFSDEVVGRATGPLELCASCGQSATRAGATTTALPTSSTGGSDALGYRRAAADMQLHDDVATWWRRSLASIFFGCLAFAAIPIAYAHKAKKALATGDAAAARRHITVAKWFCCLGYVVLVVGIIAMIRTRNSASSWMRRELETQQGVLRYGRRAEVSVPKGMARDPSSGKIRFDAVDYVHKGGLT